MTIELVLQQLIVALTALITLMGGTPVDAPISTASLVVEQQPVSYNVDMPPTTPRKVKVYSRPDFVEKPQGVFKPDVVEVAPSATDKKVKVKDTPIEVTIPSVQTTEVRYNIVPQEGSKLKKKDAITLEELRVYVLETNPNLVNFRRKMEVASVQELVNYLVQNGFTVIEN